MVDNCTLFNPQCYPERFGIMKTTFALAASLAVLGCSLAVAGEVTRTEANNGNLVMEDVPPIPQSVVADLNRYQNTRSAAFRGWDKDGEGIYVSTRFGDVSQVHYVGMPGGARSQVTFFDEPVNAISRQPGGSRFLFTMDAGGSEFSQIFMLDPTGMEDAVMLSDGESRNGAVVWNRNGQRIAYQSTRRNGASNDIWMMDVDNPETAGVVLESPDGSWWGGVDFSPDNRQLLVLNYVGNMDSRVHVVDLETRTHRMLAGDTENGGSNMPIGFDASGEGFFFVTDQGANSNNWPGSRWNKAPNRSLSPVTSTGMSKAAPSVKTASGWRSRSMRMVFHGYT
jgi:Tol biopolymer transport system component